MSLLVTNGFGFSKEFKEFRFSELAKDSNLSDMSIEEMSRRQELEKQIVNYQNHFPEFVEDCKKNRTVFCGVLDSQTEEETRAQSIQKKMHRNRVVDQIQKIIRDGILDDFKPYSEADLISAFKTLLKKNTLKNFAKKVISYPDCPSSHLLYSTGVRLEGEFPDPVFQKLAEEAYQRASDCAQDTSAIHSSYRLALLHIWANRCDLAEKVFSKIPDPDSPYFRLRIGYWRWYCADQRKDTSLKEQQKVWMAKEYPLSLHGILVQQDSGTKNVYTSNTLDPLVSTRTHLESESSEKLNEVTLIVELLLARGLQHEAGNLLQENLNWVQKAEVGFQLYWVILLRRANQTAGSFQLLKGLFKMNPDLISKTVLGHLYPDHLIPLISELSKEIDPYLILSLIRQESAFDVSAKSPAGAMGLMQLQLPTARDFEKLSAQQLYDPKVNLRVGIQYFKRLLKLYRGQVPYALIAYNAGPGRLQEWRKKYPVDNMLLFLDLLPVWETPEYVASILRNYFGYLSLYDANQLKKRIGQPSSRHLVEPAF